jgi:hypothetical protein
MGWAGKQNGELLALASSQFDRSFKRSLPMSRLCWAPSRLGKLSESVPDPNLR